jgi:hypothetical protein
MYILQTQGFIFRKKAVKSAGKVIYMSTSMVHPGTSDYDYAEIPWYIRV